MSDFKDKQSEAIEEAKAQGFEVVESSPHTLLLDLDSDEAHDQLESRLGLLNKLHYHGFTLLEEWRSKSNNWHVVINVKARLNTQTRILFELMLGSDPKRAMFSLARLYETHPNKCSLLFKPVKKSESFLTDDDVPF